MVFSYIDLTDDCSCRSNSVKLKWMDEKSDIAGKRTEDVQEPKRDSRRRKVKDNHWPNGGPSINITYNKGCTVESQNHYTIEMYGETGGVAAGTTASTSTARTRSIPRVSSQWPVGRRPRQSALPTRRM